MSDRPLTEVSTAELRAALRFASDDFAGCIRTELERRANADAALVEATQKAKTRE